MKLLIIPNSDKDVSIGCAANLLRLLQGTDCEIMTEPRCAPFLEGCGDGAAVTVGEFEHLAARCDVVIAIGGDGTIIHWAKRAAAAGKPILGINVRTIPEKTPGIVSGSATVKNARPRVAPRSRAASVRLASSFSALE